MIRITGTLDKSYFDDDEQQQQQRRMKYRKEISSLVLVTHLQLRVQ